MVVDNQDEFSLKPVYNLIIGLALDIAVFRFIALFKAQGKRAGSRCVVISLNAHVGLFDATKLPIIESKVANCVLVSLKEDRSLSIASLDFINIRLKPQLFSGAVVSLYRSPVNTLTFYDSPRFVVGIELAILWCLDGVLI